MIGRRQCAEGGFGEIVDMCTFVLFFYVTAKLSADTAKSLRIPRTHANQVKYTNQINKSTTIRINCSSYPSSASLLHLQTLYSVSAAIIYYAACRPPGTSFSGLASLRFS